jgi:Glu-tRNA(Gln) amidotransferase subunit E-like FAD-binding protein
MMSGAEVEEIVRKIVQGREDIIREQGERSLGGLMGTVMKELGGKVDGKTVKQILTDEINKLLNT